MRQMVRRATGLDAVERQASAASRGWCSWTFAEGNSALRLIYDDTLNADGPRRSLARCRSVEEERCQPFRSYAGTESSGWDLPTPRHSASRLLFGQLPEKGKENPRR